MATTETQPETQTAPDLDALASQAAEAAAAAKAAQATLAAAEAATHQEAQVRRAQAAADWLEQYDPDAEHEAVVKAGANVTKALERSELGKALLEFTEANLRAKSHRVRASTQRAVTGLAEQTGRPNRLLDHHGNELPASVSIGEIVGQLIAKVVVTAAEATIEREDQEYRDRLQAAHDSAGAAEPTHWRIVAPQPFTRLEEFVGYDVRFIRGEAYVPAERARIVNYYTRLEGFTTAPVFQVPESYSQEAGGM